MDQVVAKTSYLPEFARSTSWLTSPLQQVQSAPKSRLSLSHHTAGLVIARPPTI